MSRIIKILAAIAIGIMMIALAAFTEGAYLISCAFADSPPIQKADGG